MGKSQVGNVRRAYTDVSELTFESIKLELPIIENHVFIDRATHETIREAGIEQQNDLRENYEETGYRHVGVGDFNARKIVVLRAVEDECATVNQVQPR